MSLCGLIPAIPTKSIYRVEPLIFFFLVSEFFPSLLPVLSFSHTHTYTHTHTYFFKRLIMLDCSLDGKMAMMTMPHAIVVEWEFYMYISLLLKVYVQPWVFLMFQDEIWYCCFVWHFLLKIGSVDRGYAFDISSTHLNYVLFHLMLNIFFLTKSCHWYKKMSFLFYPCRSCQVPPLPL